MKNYIKDLYFFSKWIKETLNINALTEIFNTGSEQYIPQLKEKIDLSFSSPPYFNYETYTNCNTQCYIKYNTYDSWLKNYVKKTLENIHKYTKENGLHLVNLEDTKRIKLLNDWLDIATKVGFTLEEIETLSFDDLAYIILKEKGKKMKTTDLFKTVCELQNLNEKVYEEQIADFFTLLATEKRFIQLDKGCWDLRENHYVKIE